MASAPPMTSLETTAAPVDAETARAHVHDVVAKARTSFYWAMRTLPAAKREAMFAVYAFCRVVDDIADGEAPRPVKLAGLQTWRTEIERLFAGRPSHPIACALASPVATYRLERADFIAIIDGMEMDSADTIIAPAMADLELYCARVAGAVGLLSVKIFGGAGNDARALARNLGEAVQLTNILRDLGEDTALGRVYLPRELLTAHDVPITTPAEILRHPKLKLVCADLARIARRRFAESARLIAANDRRALRPANVILVLYRRLLDKLASREFAEPDVRVSLSKLEKLWIALRYGLL
jgi:presqualene diphosphate synthase